MGENVKNGNDVSANEIFRKGAKNLFKVEVLIKLGQKQKKGCL